MLDRSHVNKKSMFWLLAQGHSPSQQGWRGGDNKGALRQLATVRK